MTLAVGREPLTDALLDEIEPLLLAASLEVHGAALRLDRAQYLGMDAAGTYGVWVARAESGAAVGVCGMVASWHPHLGELHASQDVLYLAPEARRWSTAARFVRAVDGSLLDIGVSVVYRAQPSGTSLGALYRRLGYVLAETIFARRLDGPWPRTT